jgi:hypothetical protein
MNDQNPFSARDGKGDWEESEKLLEKWAGSVGGTQGSYYDCARLYRTIDHWVTVTNITLTIIVASAWFTSLNDGLPQAAKLILGSLGVLAAVLAVLQPVMNWKSQAEAYARGGARLGDLLKYVHSLCALPVSKRGDVKVEMEKIRKEWSTISIETPIPTKSIFEIYRKKIENQGEGKNPLDVR